MNKVCEVCLNDSATDGLWTCVGPCNRKFHASCVGVSTTASTLRGSLRVTKKDKQIADPAAYLLPCCLPCQTLVTATFEFSALSDQQKQLTAQIDENTAMIHRLTRQQEQPNTVTEVIEGMEVLLTSVKQELASINKNNSVAGTMSTLKNHLTSLVDCGIKNALTDFKNEISKSLRNINNDISQLNQLSIDTAANYTMQNNPMLELDILDELKALSANISSMQRDASPLTPPDTPSLEVEINNADNSGWRLLGTRKVWKADWSDYDDRQKRRLQQQKLKEAAKKKRDQRRMAYRNNNNNRINNSNHNNNNNNNNHNNNFNRVFNNNHRCTNHSNNNFNQLPPDRELLAAAKDQFSRPPPPLQNHHPIQFQRGEILNPYPASDAPPSVPCHTVPTWPTPGTSSSTPNQQMPRPGLGLASSSSSEPVPSAKMHSPGTTTSAAPCQACPCHHSCFARY